MRFLSTRLHGVLDYLVGALLVLAPWLFGFAGEANGAATWLPVLLGAGALAYSALTDYELGLVRRIPMPAHLLLDGASGLLLAVSPWLFGFAYAVWLPHLAVGLFEIGAALVTKTDPGDERRPAY